MQDTIIQETGLLEDPHKQYEEVEMEMIWTHYKSQQSFYSDPKKSYVKQK